MPKYTAVTPIKHDGKAVGVGDSLTLQAKDAEALLAVGAIAEAKAATSADAAAQKGAADAAEKALAAQPTPSATDVAPAVGDPH